MPTQQGPNLRDQFAAITTRRRFIVAVCAMGLQNHVYATESTKEKNRLATELKKQIKTGTVDATCRLFCETRPEIAGTPAPIAVATTQKMHLRGNGARRHACSV